MGNGSVNGDSAEVRPQTMGIGNIPLYEEESEIGGLRVRNEWDEGGVLFCCCFSRKGARHQQGGVRRATSEAGLLRAPYPVGYYGDT